MYFAVRKRTFGEANMSSLAKELESNLACSTNPLERITILNELADLYMYDDVDRSVQYALDVVKEAQSFGGAHQADEGLAAQSGLARAQYLLARSYFDQQRYSDSLNLLETCASTFKDIEDNESLAQVLELLSKHYVNEGSQVDAIDALQHAHTLYEKLWNKEGSARVLEQTGSVIAASGDYPNAIEYFRKSIRFYTQTGNDAGHIRALTHMGAAHRDMGDYPAALECYLSAHKISEDDPGLKELSVDSLIGLGEVYVRIEYYHKALEHLFKALRIAEEVSYARGQAKLQNVIGDVYVIGLQDLPGALDCFTRALSLWRDLKNKHGEAQVENSIGTVYLDLGEYKQALEHFYNSLNICEEVSLKQVQTEALLYIGETYEKLLDESNALEYLSIALDIAESTKARPVKVRVHAALSRIHKVRREFERALYHHEKFLELTKLVFSKEAEEKIRNMEFRHQLFSARKEAEIFRLKNVELGTKNTELEKLNNNMAEFLSIAAHDLKNPLAGVILSAGLVRHNADRLTAKQIKDQLSKIELSAVRMKDIVSRLLDLNAIESGSIVHKQVRVNLSRIVRNAIALYQTIAENKGITVLNKSETDVEIIGEDGALATVVENLLSNAIKYSEAGGTVTLSASSHRDYIQLSVVDHGQGIPESEIATVFDRFANISSRPTAGESTSGLGLSIVKTIVEVLDGSIDCTSEVGQGTVFTVTFPKP